MAAVTLADKEFTGFLHRCILDKSREFIGESATESLFSYLKLDQHLGNPKEFHRKLESVLSKGTVVLERSIVRELFRRLNSSYEEAKPFEFEKCVDRARKVFVAKMKGE